MVILFPHYVYLTELPITYHVFCTLIEVLSPFIILGLASSLMLRFDRFLIAAWLLTMLSTRLMKVEK